MASLGLDCYAIQLLGRWGTDTVMRYIRDAAVSPDAARSRLAGFQRNLSILTHLHESSTDGTAALDEEKVKKIVEAAFPEAVAGLRKSLLAELTEHINNM